MEFKTSEATSGITWLIGAGAAAIGLSLFLFWADDSVMGKAKERDIAHNAAMRELRIAQSSLASGVTDERQTLGLTIDQDASANNGRK